MFNPQSTKAHPAKKTATEQMANKIVRVHETLCLPSTIIVATLTRNSACKCVRSVPGARACRLYSDGKAFKQFSYSQTVCL